MVSLPMFSIENIRSWSPCYDPATGMDENGNVIHPGGVLPEGWEGTALELLKVSVIPPCDRIWAVRRRETGVPPRVWAEWARWCAAAAADEAAKAAAAVAYADAAAAHADAAAAADDAAAATYAYADAYADAAAAYAAYAAADAASAVYTAAYAAAYAAYAYAATYEAAVAAGAAYDEERRRQVEKLIELLLP